MSFCLLSYGYNMALTKNTQYNWNVIRRAQFNGNKRNVLFNISSLQGLIQYNFPFTFLIQNILYDIDIDDHYRKFFFFGQRGCGWGIVLEKVPSEGS